MSCGLLLKCSSKSVVVWMRMAPMDSNILMVWTLVYGNVWVRQYIFGRDVSLRQALRFQKPMKFPLSLFFFFFFAFCSPSGVSSQQLLQSHAYLLATMFPAMTVMSSNPLKLWTPALFCSLNCWSWCFILLSNRKRTKMKSQPIPKCILYI